MLGFIFSSERLWEDKTIAGDFQTMVLDPLRSIALKRSRLYTKDESFFRAVGIRGRFASIKCMCVHTYARHPAIQSKDRYGKFLRMSMPKTADVQSSGHLFSPQRPSASIASSSSVAPLQTLQQAAPDPPLAPPPASAPNQINVASSSSSTAAGSPTKRLRTNGPNDTCEPGLIRGGNNRSRVAHAPAAPALAQSTQLTSEVIFLLSTRRQLIGPFIGRQRIDQASLAPTSSAALMNSSESFGRSLRLG